MKTSRYLLFGVLPEVQRFVREPKRSFHWVYLQKQVGERRREERRWVRKTTGGVG